MTTKNYQITWYGQISSKVVATPEEAKALKAETLADYKKSYDAGWVTNYDPNSVQIQITAKKIGEY